MSADALVSDATRAPVDVMLPKCILQILSFYWCRFLSYSCTVCMSRNVRKFSVPCVTSVTWTNLSLYLIITWRINRQHDDLIVPANAWGSIYVGLITKLSFQKIHLKKSVARSPPCCVLSHRYRYRSFNQYCSGLLHRQWGKHIVGQTIARAIRLTRTYFLWSPQSWKHHKYPCFWKFPPEFGDVFDIHSHWNNAVQFYNVNKSSIKCLVANWRKTYS